MDNKSEVTLTTRENSAAYVVSVRITNTIHLNQSPREMNSETSNIQQLIIETKKHDSR